MNAFDQPKNTNIFLGCGQSATLNNPILWKIQSDGSKQFSRSLNIASTSYCYGINYNYDKAQSTLLLSSNVDAIKTVNKGYTTSPQDAFIFIITDSGTIIRGQQISFSSSSATNVPGSVKFGINALKKVGEYFIFAGYSTGFSTKF